MASKMTKRVAKDGTITWTCVIDAPAGPDGKRRQKRFSASTRKELEALVAKTIHAVNTGGYVEPVKTTVNEYLTGRWLPSIAASVRESTHIRYERVVRVHVVPAVGNLTIARMTPLAIQ